MFDSIIIGTGPAGLSAALNLKIYKKDFIWFGSKDLSSKVQKAEKIANYPGIPMASGQQLFEAFDSHRQAMGIEITEKTVTNVMQSEGHFMVLADNELYESKTLILCMGVLNAKLLEGEEQFLGRGLSYCATCDGAFFRRHTLERRRDACRQRRPHLCRMECACPPWHRNLYDKRCPWYAYGSLQP